MDAEIAEFRDEMQQRRGARRKGAAPYPEELMARGRGLAAQLRDAGVGVTATARSLGVAVKTLKKWTVGEEGKAKGRGGFVEVAVKNDRPKPKRAEVTVGVRIVSPRGYRIDGVDLATAVAILREVG
jgi:hypothetical protein